MPFHSSLAIANEFLRRGHAEGRALTPMHLQKLVYLAHGWNLAISNRPLIEENIEAWKFGPVVRPLYQALKSYGSKPVSELIEWGDDFGPNETGAVATASLNQTETGIIDRVWANYKGFEAFQLSALTHEPDTPWDRTFDPMREGRVIGANEIQNYFSELAARHE